MQTGAWAADDTQTWVPWCLFLGHTEGAWAPVDNRQWRLSIFFYCRQGLGRPLTTDSGALVFFWARRQGLGAR